MFTEERGQEIMDSDNIVKEPFTKYKLDEEKERETGKIFTIRLNAEEIKELQMAKKVIKQPKDSSAIKTLAKIGFGVLQGKSPAWIIELALNNIQRNKRSGNNEY